VPAILVGEPNYSKIEPIVGNAFYPFEYNRIWWPNQDYFSLTLQSLWNDLRNPSMRAAWFQIWLNRDFTKYGQVTGRDMSLENWSPAQHLRLYLRKDIVAKLWDYGVVAAPEEIVPEYEKSIQLSADKVVGSAGIEPGQFTNPRNIALGLDGSLFIADTNNHRIQHMSADGTLINTWGAFADLSKGDAPGGTFFEPWGIAVGPDGTVYVADTWNHRIQRFSPDGEFISMWGNFGQAETLYALWGPRGIVVDNQGRVYVTDTGNKRVVIYDMNGEAINEFGSAGFEPGQFNEPVGITIDSDGNLYITDTWNQRIQVLIPDDAGNYTPLRDWDITAWYGQSLDNKPYIAVDQRGHIYTSDPEGNRVIEFTNEGQFIQYWGDYGSTPDRFNLPTGMALDQEGGLWVADAGNNRLMYFILPQE
jgi:DNA-binding beta-propeller fold protein YncE